jgi:hypothetical protein
VREEGVTGRIGSIRSSLPDLDRSNQCADVAKVAMSLIWRYLRVTRAFRSLEVS